MYLRKSRSDIEAEAHGEGETLLRHENTLLDLAKKQKLDIKEIYREIVSGETIEARPEMQRLLEDIALGKWTGVLVVEIERLARGDTIDQGTVSKAFKLSNTLIITPSKTYDPNNEFDEEYFEFGLFMSRREYKTINRRIQRGRLESVKEGKYIASTPPYGYDKVKIKNDKGYTLEPNQEQCLVVQMMYEWYVIGDVQADGYKEKLGPTRIANKLNSMVIKSATNSTWSKASVTDILKNPVYTGKIRWSYKKEENFLEDGHLRKTRIRSSDDYILVDGLHDAIIDQELFDKAQELRKGRTHAPVPGNDILKNPFTGLIYCDKCGNRLTRLAKNKKTPYDTIKCPNTQCDNISSPLYLVEEVIIKSLAKWLIEFKIEWTEWSDNKINGSYVDTLTNKELIIKQLKNNLEKKLEQKERIHTLLEQGVYSPDVFLKRDEKIVIEIEELENIIMTNTNELVDLKTQAEYNDVFIPKVKNIIDIYYELESASAKNDVLKEVLEKIKYVKNEPNKRGDRDNKNFTVHLFPKVIRF